MAVEKKPAARTRKPATKRPATPRKPAAKRPRAASAVKAVKAAKAPRVSKAPPALDVNEARRVKTREVALLVAAAALEKKAERIEIIDLGDKVDYADFVVLMSGRSDRQVQAIAGGVTQLLKERGHPSKAMEGYAQGQWVLIDFDDVVAHVFLEDARQYYDIEGLWMDAPRVSTEGARLPPVIPAARQA
ncbi:MAG: ribosome silencing factor [Deltaproteobacteria bacterium]|nr:ribosome silencing factor [Deltaproteobacteria bacterium]